MFSYRDNMHFQRFFRVSYSAFFFGHSKAVVSFENGSNPLSELKIFLRDKKIPDRISALKKGI